MAGRLQVWTRPAIYGAVLSLLVVDLLQEFPDGFIELVGVFDHRVVAGAGEDCDFAAGYPGLGCFNLFLRDEPVAVAAEEQDRGLDLAHVVALVEVAVTDEVSNHDFGGVALDLPDDILPAVLWSAVPGQ